MDVKLVCAVTKVKWVRIGERRKRIFRKFSLRIVFLQNPGPLPLVTTNIYSQLKFKAIIYGSVSNLNFEYITNNYTFNFEEFPKSPKKECCHSYVYFNENVQK